MELNGKSAIVTGASSGIGAATAIKLAREGVKVGLAARRRDRLQKSRPSAEKPLRWKWM